MRKLIEKNYFLNDFVRRNALKKQNNEVISIVNKLTAVDSIKSFREFEKVINEIKYFNGIVFSVKRAFGESILYGHLNAVADYASVNQDEYIYFPVLEHGVHFWESVSYSPLSRICQGEYLFEPWKKAHPNVPIFAIGPYIHYAKDYYDESTFKSLKQQLGKTVLIFPAHTHEMSTQEYNMKKFVDDTMNQFKDDFDTIMVSAYWADLKYELYNYFEEAGAKIVSAGFRGDPNFISRLKTIISLSDYVVGNDLGTFVGYAAYLNKPVALIENDIQYNFMDMGEDATENLAYNKNLKLFYDNFKINAPVDKDTQDSLCNAFWGTQIVKTKDEIRDILEVNKQILKTCHGTISAIPKAVDKLLNSSKLTDNQRKILKDSI